MITINKKSLIHRFNVNFGIKDSWWWNEQTNLCPYFWGTVASIIKFIVCSFFFVCVPTAFFSGLGYAILGDMFGKEVWGTYWILSSPLVGILVLLSLVLVAMSIVCIVFGIKYLFSWCYQNITNCSSERETNIFFEYIKAKKSKICPQIQIK